MRSLFVAFILSALECSSYWINDGNDKLELHGGGEGVDCATVVTPRDPPVLRSPQKVHSYLSKRFAGRHVVEIGSRYGDSMSCFGRRTASLTIFEAEPSYCPILEQRLQKMKQELATGASKTSGMPYTTTRSRQNDSAYSLQCAKFDDKLEEAPDADFYTWWIIGGVNDKLLCELHRRVTRGQVRTSVQAVILFDHQVESDMENLLRLHNRTWIDWSLDIAYNETGLCESLRPQLVSASGKSKNPWAHFFFSRFPQLCSRAAGTFTVLALGVAHIKREECMALDQQRHRQTHLHVRGRSGGRGRRQAELPYKDPGSKALL